MIWEQNCPAIVNLTRCVEKGRVRILSIVSFWFHYNSSTFQEKCDQYWPGDTDPVYYGDVEVLLMNETRFPDWTVREFRVTNVSIF
jgi:receptor-type tyrosine-protein phosphatase beta